MYFLEFTDSMETKLSTHTTGVVRSIEEHSHADNYKLQKVPGNTPWELPLSQTVHSKLCTLLAVWCNAAMRPNETVNESTSLGVTFLIPKPLIPQYSTISQVMYSLTWVAWTPNFQKYIWQHPHGRVKGYTAKRLWLLSSKFMIVSVVHLFPQHLALNRCEECVKCVE